MIIKVKELKGIRTAGETQYFFKPKTPAGADSSGPHHSQSEPRRNRCLLQVHHHCQWRSKPCRCPSLARPRQKR